MCTRFRSLFLSLAVLTFFAPLTKAQNVPDRIKTIQNNLDSAKAAYDRLSDDQKKYVKPDRRLIQLGDALRRITPALSNGAQGNWQPSDGWDQGGEDEDGLIQVNNPARDLRFSPFIGYTQVDSSTARCGDNVVVAFSDSGSILETLFSGRGGVTNNTNVTPPATTGGISSSGYATSNDGGATFRDRGAVPPGPDPNTFLMGQPSVACSSPNKFYMVQEAILGNTAPPGAPNNVTAIVHGVAFSSSNDGGGTWSDPVFIALPDPTAFFSNVDSFEDPRIAVDPTNPKRIFVAYVHMQFLTSCSVFFSFSPQSTIEIMTSNDGGRTFDPNPSILDSQCIFDSNLTDVGVRMAVSSQGIVYAAWQIDEKDPSVALFNGFALVPVAIQVGSIAPTGRAAFPTTVDSVFPLRGSLLSEPLFGFGDVSTALPFFNENLLYALQGGFSNLRGFDIAVDRSGGPTDGNVYVAWDDGRHGAFGAFELEDVVSFSYSFTDILFASSSDGGQTFTPTQQLNSDLQPTTSRGHDHFRPVLAVDRKGKLAACWYDRRNDPQNYQFERFCAESKNAGTNWTEFRVPGSLSTPSTQQDWLVLRPLMGTGNDDLITDFMGHNPGFLGGVLVTTSGMNPDIKLEKFQ